MYRRNQITCASSFPVMTVCLMLGPKSRKNFMSHMNAASPRQSLVKGERLTRYELAAVMVELGRSVLPGWEGSCAGKRAQRAPSEGTAPGKHICSPTRLRRRPYFVENTRSHLNSEVKRRKARLVPRWGTARENLRVLTAFCFARGSQRSACRASPTRRKRSPERH